MTAAQVANLCKTACPAYATCDRVCDEAFALLTSKTDTDKE